jgi:periplasmic protein TonB
MGYQALLFCPDEKLARVVSQVFSELDFTIEPVHEPFAAVKKLMSQRYDAIVVDCENEQNASLLFKSARNSSSNQSSLAIALVEGQSGVAKAYRIGANLVLTKPINVEQAKGTLRVARGLLRKNADAAGAGAANASATAKSPKTSPTSAGNSFQRPIQTTASAVPPSGPAKRPEFEAPMPTAHPAEMAPDFGSISASASIENAPAMIPASRAQAELSIATESLGRAQSESAPVIKRDIVNNDGAVIAPTPIGAQTSASSFTSAPGSAAAPAPAKEQTAAEPRIVNTKLVEPQISETEIEESKIGEKRVEEKKIGENKVAESRTAEPEFENPSRDTAAPPMTMLSTLHAGATPSFAGLDDEDSGESGSKKKILIVVAAVLVLAALIYFGYGKLGKSSGTAAPQSVSLPESAAPAAAATPSPSAPSTITVDQTATAAREVAPRTTSAAATDKSSASAGAPPVIRIGADPEPETKKPGPTPLRVKSNPGAVNTKASAEDSAPALPSSDSAASASDRNLTGLMSSSAPSLPKPELATLKISQGVSQGLLIKRVQPKYPQAALAVHAQGAVEIEATINKEGNVINPKVLRGDPTLARSALEAVRQWRYKPYYLDGEPVEIETEITINFKAE